MATFQRTREGDVMIPVEEAQRRVLEEVAVGAAEPVALADVLGRVLREDIVAWCDVPSDDNSAMDGYAVRAADVEQATGDVPAVLHVVDDIPAGVVPKKKIEARTAARIMTGALVPSGADAVVQVESTDAGSPDVRVFQPVAPGTNIRRRGDDMRAGSIVLRAGTVIGPAACGVLASVQRRGVLAGKQPTVAILSTGDELVEVGGDLAPGKVVNSNSYALAALVREAGAIPRMHGLVSDTRQATVAAIESALDCDFVVSSGGVSAGAYDFVKDALDDLGAELKFWRVAMKPGKPVVFAPVRGRLYFGLPGNPVSLMVAFVLFVAPALRKAMGKSDGLVPPVVNIRCGAPLKAKGDRRTYVRVRIVARNGELVALPMISQGSHVSTSMVTANGLAVVEEGITRIQEGDLAPVLVIGAIAADG
jgi:molybdopterin molybdotransferase